MQVDADAVEFGRDAADYRERDLEPSRAVVFAGVLISIPVFLSIGAVGVGLGQPGREIFRQAASSVDVAVSSVFLPATLIWSWADIRADKVARERAYFFVFATVLATVYGLARTGGALLGILYAYQTIVPLCALAVGYSAAKRGSARTLLSSMATTISMFAFAHLALTLLMGLDPVTGVRGGIWFWNNSKILRFFPAASALAACLLLFPKSFLSPWFGRHRNVSYGLAASCGAVVLLSHSRTALLLGSLGVVVLLIRNPRQSAYGKGLRLATLAVAAAIVASTSARSVQRLSEVTGSDADARRVQAWISSLSQGFSGPLGRGFAATVDVSTGGQRVSLNRVAISENQYGEYLVRGGPILIVAASLIIVLALKRTLRRPKHSLTPSSIDSRPLLLLVVIWTIVSTTTQLSLTETYLAPIIWSLIGIALEPPPTPVGDRVEFASAQRKGGGCKVH